MVNIEALIEERQRMDAANAKQRNNYVSLKNAVNTYNAMKPYTMFDG